MSNQALTHIYNLINEASNSCLLFIYLFLYLPIYFEGTSGDKARKCYEELGKIEAAYPV